MAHDRELIDRMVDTEILEPFGLEPDVRFAITTVLANLRYLKLIVEKEGIPFSAISRELLIERFTKKHVTGADVEAARQRVIKQFDDFARKSARRTLTPRPRGDRARATRAR